MAETVLAFGAHPDDIELTVGGTVARLAKEGHEVHLCDLTRGELGTRGTPEKRAEEAREAAHRLGATARHQAGLPDGHLGPDRQFLKPLVEVLREVQPRLVLAPLEEDLHPDHKWAGRLVKEACFLAGLRNWAPSSLPPHRPRGLLHYLSHTQAEPDLVIDITETFEQKRQACLAYESQFHDPSSTEPATYISSARFWDWWEARARSFGHLVGATFGEAFVHAGPLRIEDPVALFSDYGYYP